MTVEAEQLAAVYERAIEIIEQRGWAQTYTFKSGAPVDLPRALILAEKDTGWPTTLPSPIELLSEHQQQTCSALSRELDRDQAIDLLHFAVRSSEAFLEGNLEDLEAYTATEQHKPWACRDCGVDLPVRRTRMPHYCEPCKAARDATKVPRPPKPRLCEGCGHDFGPGRGRAPRFCSTCKESKGK